MTEGWSQTTSELWLADSLSVSAHWRMLVVSRVQRCVVRMAVYDDAYEHV